MNLPFPRQPGKKIRIKLEADSNPPKGSVFESRYLDFPTVSAITVQTLPSGFVTKSHALLCREYTKGRDWYDFLWFVSKKVTPDPALLGYAIEQQGPWAGKAIRVTEAWYLEAMRNRIEEIDWDKARQDVKRFVPAREQETLELWKPDLFFQYLDRLAGYMDESNVCEIYEQAC